MIGQLHRIADEPPEFGPNRGPSRIALEWRRDSMNWKALPHCDWRCPRDRTAARHEHVIICQVEILEARSVLSGLGHRSLSGLASAIQAPTTDLVHSAMMLPSELGEPVVLSSSNSPSPLPLPIGRFVATATGAMLDVVNSGLNLVGSLSSPALPIGGVVAKATGAVLHAVNSDLNLAGSLPSPALPTGSVVAKAASTVLEALNSGPSPVAASPPSVPPPIDLDLGSHVASAGSAVSDVAEALLALAVSSIHVEVGSQIDGDRKSVV
jgi:hypothetical protein